MKLAVSYLTRAKNGETVSGDAVVIRHHFHKASLLAVVDALGHGPGAAETAGRASRYLEAVSLGTGVRQIVTGLHGEMRGTRGAAAMVCCVTDADDGLRLEGCGVGNVELRLTSGHVPVVLSPGILGGSVRQFRVFHGTVRPGTRLVLFSDGISARFSIDSLRQLAPLDACTRLMTEFGRAHDDATVVIADTEN